MATGKSGKFELTGNRGITLEISWAETYDVATNKSTVSITKIRAKSSSYYATYYLHGTIKINGTTAITMNSSLGTHNVYTQTLNTYYNVLLGETGEIATGSVSGISHNNDGTKSVDIVVDITGWTTSGSAGSGWVVEGSKTIELATIPRVSKPTVSASSVKMGNAVTIYTNRKATSLTHTLTYSFGGSTGTIATGVGDSYQWTVPDLASKISGATSGKCTITCQTYAGGTPVGSSSVDVVLTVPAASVPTVSLATVQMGKSVQISTNRKSSAFTHEIAYTIGSKTEVISSSVGTSTAWTPHKDLAAYTGNKKSATCTITCKTYNGSALVGTQTVSLTLNVPNATVLTLDKTSVAMGKTLTIGTPRETTAYTHDLTYYIAGVDGPIATDVSTGHTWSIPITLAAKVPEETSAEVTVICTTKFKGSTSVVGTSSAKFTATVPKDETTQPKVKSHRSMIAENAPEGAATFPVSLQGSMWLARQR